MPSHYTEKKKGLKKDRITQPELPGIRLSDKTVSYANKHKLKK